MYSNELTDIPFELKESNSPQIGRKNVQSNLLKSEDLTIFEFDKLERSEEYKFEKIPINIEKFKESELRKILTSTNRRGMKITIYPEWDTKHPIHLIVNPSDSTEIVINQSIEKLFLGDVQESSENFVLRLAELDGSPDSDFPALARRKSVSTFRAEAFSLCRTKRRNTTSSRRGSRNGSTYMRAEGTFFLKVFLPNTEYVIITAIPEMILRDLLMEIGKKRNIGPDLDNYYFQETELSPKLLLDSPLPELIDNQLFLIQIKTNNNPDLFADIRIMTSQTQKSSVVMISEDVTPESFMFTSVTASQYSEFSTVKIPGRVPTTIGIDGQKIEITPIKRRWRNKKIIIQISDVKHASIEKNSRQFKIIEKRDFYTFEATSEHDAAIIVAKLRFLMK